MTLPQRSLREPALVCFDFDLTLTHEHLYHAVRQQIAQGARRERACLLAAQRLARAGARGGEELWDTLHALLSAGHGVAVTSFTCFPELPMTLLAHGVPRLRACGAPREVTSWLSRPVVVYGDPDPALRPPFKLAGAHLARVPPERFEEVGKGAHMALARERVAEERGRRFERLVLVDDDARNVSRALEEGHEAITAPQDPLDRAHLAALRAALEL